MIETRKISVGELSRIVEGHLNLGSMPPIGGEWEPVRRLITDYSRLLSGDVLVSLSEHESDSRVLCGEAFARGALGIVCSRPIEPWAGKFSIHVSDVGSAASRLHNWAVSAFPGTRIAICGSTNVHVVADLISKTVSMARGGRAYLTGPSDPHSLNVLEYDNHCDMVVGTFDFTRHTGLERWLESARPDLLVVTSSEFEKKSAHESREAPIDWKPILDFLPMTSRLIVNGDDQVLGQFPPCRNQDIVRVGRRGTCDARISNINCQNGTSFHFNGLQVSSKLVGRHHVQSLALALEVGRALDVPTKALVKTIAAFELSGIETEVIDRTDMCCLLGAHKGRWSAVETSLQLLAETPCTGTRTIVNVARPNANPVWTQRQLGSATVLKAGAEKLFALGGEANEFLEGAREAGIPDRSIQVWPESSAGGLQQHLRKETKSGDVVLFLGATREEIRPLVAHLEAA